MPQSLISAPKCTHKRFYNFTFKIPRVSGKRPVQPQQQSSQWDKSSRVKEQVEDGAAKPIEGLENRARSPPRC
ncbi:hypothetical protein GQ457_11G007560 [Hibiscus cannabinus]